MVNIGDEWLLLFPESNQQPTFLLDEFDPQTCLGSILKFRAKDRVQPFNRFQRC